GADRRGAWPGTEPPEDAGPSRPEAYAAYGEDRRGSRTLGGEGHRARRQRLRASAQPVEPVGGEALHHRELVGARRVDDEVVDPRLAVGLDEVETGLGG